MEAWSQMNNLDELIDNDPQGYRMAQLRYEFIFRPSII
jgi:hypothetical protein